VDLLQQEGVEFGTFDILSDEGVRQKLKELSEWPTYPQLYIKSELVGGIDIVQELIETGEFKDMLQ
jgi:glutaredoxin-related protein